MTAVWLTSDLHFGHKLVAETRGYDDTDTHDTTIMRNWRRMIRPQDTVWVLGDISSGGAAAQRHAIDLLTQLPGDKRLVAGNHDSVSPIHGPIKAITWEPVYRTAFNYICSQARLRVEGVKLLLSHYPYAHDRGDEIRYPEWRYPDEGHWLAHGHTHSAAVTHTHPREIHVGLDAWNLRPVNLGQIAKLIKQREQCFSENGGYKPTTGTGNPSKCVRCGFGHDVQQPTSQTTSPDTAPQPASPASDGKSNIMADDVRMKAMINYLWESRRMWQEKYQYERDRAKIRETLKQEIERWKQDPRDYEYRAAMHRSEDYFQKWSNVAKVVDETAALHTKAPHEIVCKECRTIYPCRTALLVKPATVTLKDLSDDPDGVMPWPEALGGMHG